MHPRFLDSIAYAEAVSLIRAASSSNGILASVTEVTNYRQVWTRDGIIVGLATLLSEEDALIRAFRATLETLAGAQTSSGQIPNNVRIDDQGKIERAGFGTICGRVDPSLWFVIGVCNYIILNQDRKFAREMASTVSRALEALSFWEFNHRGLIYVPQSGDWADEFVLHGYVLLEQLLRLWALRCHAKAYDDASSAAKANRLQELIETNYWPEERNKGSSLVYHETAFARFLSESGQPEFWLCSLAPGGYFTYFDGFSNALSVLLGMGKTEQNESVLQHGRLIQNQLGQNMIPCFWPPITQDQSGWEALRNNYKFEFKNRPFEYHNGGLWPMVNGWWGLAHNTVGQVKQARRILAGIETFNQKARDDDEWGFFEYAHAQTGEPLGTPKLTWSAAGMLLLDYGLAGRSLYFGAEQEPRVVQNHQDQPSKK